MRENKKKEREGDGKEAEKEVSANQYMCRTAALYLMV